MSRRLECSSKRLRYSGLNDENETEDESMSGEENVQERITNNSSVSQEINVHNDGLNDENESERERMSADENFHDEENESDDPTTEEEDSVNEIIELTDTSNSNEDEMEEVEEIDYEGELTQEEDSVHEVEEDDNRNEGGNIENLEDEELIITSSEDENEEDNAENDENSSDIDSEEEDNEDNWPEHTMFQGFDGLNGLRAPVRNTGEQTSLDHILCELTHVIKYNNTYDQLLRKFQMLKKTHVNLNVPTTKKALWRMLGRDDSNLKYQLYCDKCNELVANGKKVQRNCSCGACGPDKNETFVATFIQVRLAPQIKQFLDSPHAAESLRYRETRVKIDPNAIEDIYDGAEYRHTYEEYLRNRQNFTLTLWTDGLRLANSSKASCYPFLLQLNELSPHARKRNMFLAGVWVGKEKPNIGVIMKPIVSDINELYDTGIKWKPTPEQEIVSKFIVVIFTADSVCKPMVLRCHLYNGQYGCPLCLQKGKSVERRWIFAVEDIVLRTAETMRADIEAVMESGVQSRGILGCSRLGSLKGFDLINGQVVDIAHKDYLGNAKKFHERHMQDVGKDWYIGISENKKAINNILTNIKTPSRISRKPRGLETSKTWKASEWRNWLLYYSLPCLDGILKEEFFIHQAKYSEAIFILNSASITEEDLTKARTYLNEFFNESQDLYGERNMWFNLHLNRHCVKSTEDWGPAWVFSTLPYESMNKPIADSVKSPNHRAEQIVTRFFMKKFVLRIAEEEEISRTTRKEIMDLLEKKTLNVPQDMPEGHYFVGKNKFKTQLASLEEIGLISNAGAEIDEITRLSFYRKATVHGASYSKKVERTYKYCDHIAYCRSKKFIIIRDIVSYLWGQETIAGFIGEEFQDLGGAYNTEYMRFVRETRNRIFVSYHDILAPGILITAKKGTVAVQISNCWETD